MYDIICTVALFHVVLCPSEGWIKRRVFEVPFLSCLIDPLKINFIQHLIWEHILYIICWDPPYKIMLKRQNTIISSENLPSVVLNFSSIFEIINISRDTMQDILWDVKKMQSVNVEGSWLWNLRQWCFGITVKRIR